MITNFAAFLVTALLLTITPGLDTALVVRTFLVHGRREALLAGLGIACGCLLWGASVAIGLGALLKTSEVAFELLRWCGAAYLTYLGLKLITGRASGQPDMPANNEPLAAKRQQWFAAGFLTNILNPKVGLFYLSFLPQFVPAGFNPVITTLALAAVHAGLGVIWFICLLETSGRIVALLRAPHILRWLDRAVGSLFLLFAARLVTTRVVP